MEITKKDFIETEELWVSIFKCPHCKEECIQQNDNYCCECGKKIEWSKDSKEYFV